MKIGRTARDAIVIASIVLVCSAISVSPALERIHGLSIDILTALRWQAFGKPHDPAKSPAVVVAIDEESYRAAPFKGSPTLTWTGEIGRVLGAVLEGGAKVAGFDMVIPTSIEQSEIPFGEGVLGERVRGFDRDFLRALAGASSSGKDRARRGAARRPADPALPRPTHRRSAAAEYPPPERLYR